MSHLSMPSGFVEGANHEQVAAYADCCARVEVLTRSYKNITSSAMRALSRFTENPRSQEVFEASSRKYAYLVGRLDVLKEAAKEEKEKESDIALFSPPGTLELWRKKIQEQEIAASRALQTMDTLGFELSLESIDRNMEHVTRLLRRTNIQPTTRPLAQESRARRGVNEGRPPNTPHTLLRYRPLQPQ